MTGERIAEESAPRICFTCKHYLAWHFNFKTKGGECGYHADGRVCSCAEFKE